MTINFNSSRRTFLVGIAGLTIDGTVGVGDVATASILPPVPEPVVAINDVRPKNALIGTLKVINQASIVLTTRDGKDQAVAVNEHTKIVAGKNAKATLSDLKVGELVSVLLAGKDDNNLTARVIVQDIRQQGVGQKNEAVHGRLTAINGTTLTVEGNRGPVTIQTNAQTRFNVPGMRNATIADLKVGDMVTVVGERNNANGITARIVTTGTRKQTKDAVKKTTAAGTVSAINGNTLTITRRTRKGTITETVQLAADTEFFKGKKEAASRSDLQVGSEILVRGTTDTNGTFTAKTVYIVK